MTSSITDETLGVTRKARQDDARGCGEMKTSVVALSEEDMELLNARSRFFPFWWKYIGLTQESIPVYQVTCSSARELELAQAAKPDVVKAHYRLVEIQPGDGRRSRS